MALSVCPAVTQDVPVVTPTRHPTVPEPSLAGCRKPESGAAVLVGLGVVVVDGTGVGPEMVVLGTGVGGKVILVGTGVSTALHGVACSVHAHIGEGDTWTW